MERRKLPPVDSTDDDDISKQNGDNAMSQEEAMLQDMFETYNLEFRETDMFDFLKEKLNQLEASNVTEIFQSEKKVQHCVDKMEIASSRLDDFKCYMDTIHVKLQHMRKDIKAIDMQNHVFNIQRRNNNILLEKLDSIFENSEISAKTREVLDNGALDPPNWNDTLDAIQSLTNTMTYSTGNTVHHNDSTQQDEDKPPITGLEHIRGIKDLNSQLISVKNKFVNRAIPALSNRFRMFIEKYGGNTALDDSSSEHSHHKLHRRLSIYTPLITKLRKLDRSFCVRAGSAYASSMNVLLRSESTTLLRSLNKSYQSNVEDVTNMDDDEFLNDKDEAKYTMLESRHFIKWLWRFVPHMVKELEFTITFLFSDEASGSSSSKSIEIAEEDVEVVDILATNLFKTFGEEIRNMVSHMSNQSGITQLIVMQSHVKAWINYFSTKDYTSILKRIFTKANDGLTVALSTFLQQQQRDRMAVPTSASSVKGIHVLPIVVTTTTLFSDIANEDIDLIKSYKIPSEFISVLEDVAFLTKSQANNVLETLGFPLIETLKTLASSDKKHGDRLLVENLGVIVGGLPEKVKFTHLAKFVDSVLSIYEKSLTAYVTDQMNYHLSPVMRFVDLLDRTMPVMDRHEIGYQQGCTRTDLRKALHSSFQPNVERVLSSIKARIEKHFGPVTRNNAANKNISISEKVWQRCQKDILGKMIKLEKIINLVFVDEKLNPSVHEIKEMFKAV